MRRTRERIKSIQIHTWKGIGHEAVGLVEGKGRDRKERKDKTEKIQARNKDLITTITQNQRGLPLNSLSMTWVVT
jgi:hypothetical protein